MWGNHTDDDDDEKAIFQNAPLEKSDNCEYEGGGELSWGKEGGGGGKYENYWLPSENKKLESTFSERTWLLC